MGALGCFGLGAMLAAVALWLLIGVLAGGQDYQRFDGDPAPTNRAGGNIVAYTIMLMGLAGVIGAAALGLLGLGVWMISARRGR